MKKHQLKVLTFFLVMFLIFLGLGLVILALASYIQDNKDKCPQGYTCEKTKLESNICFTVQNESLWVRGYYQPIWGKDVRGYLENGTQIPRCDEVGR